MVWESVLDNFIEYCHEKISDCIISKYSLALSTQASIQPLNASKLLTYTYRHFPDLTSCHCRHSWLGSRRRRSWWGSADRSQMRGWGQHWFSSSRLETAPGPPGLWQSVGWPGYGHGGVLGQCLSGMVVSQLLPPSSLLCSITTRSNWQQIWNCRMETVWAGDCVCSVTVHSGVN